MGGSADKSGGLNNNQHGRHGRPKVHRLTHGKITGSLCCDSAEEARTLIPSLEGKIADEDLQVVLDNISKLRVFD